MDNIQRAVSILLGALMVAYLLINVRTQQTSYEPMAQVEECVYPVLEEEELALL
jgi:hypothetical protein